MTDHELQNFATQVHDSLIHHPSRRHQSLVSLFSQLLERSGRPGRVVRVLVSVSTIGADIQTNGSLIRLRMPNPPYVPRGNRLRSLDGARK